MLREEESYGIILVDTSGATLAFLRGKRLEIVREITSGIPGKHRAGGQSARRFERLREMGVNAFFGRVSEYADEIFLQLDDLKGILLGGPGPTKHEFQDKNKMHYTLRNQILATFDTAYIGEQGVKEIVDRSSETIRRVRYIEEKELIQGFLYELGHDTGMAIYGYDEVLSSLNQGLVKTLLLSEGLDAKGVDLSCSTCGRQSTRTLFGPDILKFAENLNKEPCPECGNTSLSLVQENDLLDILADLAEEKGIDIEVVSTETEDGSMLLKSFGGIAAVLHFAHR
jgi:peptide chain release factor subunit 1